MRQFFLSEQHIIKLALLPLTNHLKGEIELVTELNAEFFSSGVPDELPEEVEGEKLIESPTLAVPFDALMQDVFRKADEALRRYGLSTQADEILRLYGNSCENAKRTLEYVKKLLANLELEEVDEKTQTQKPEETNKKRKRLRGKINDRMLALLVDKPGKVKGWTCREWAGELKCGKSTIATTKAWQTLKDFRLEQKAKRASDRQRNRRENAESLGIDESELGS